MRRLMTAAAIMVTVASLAPFSAHALSCSQIPRVPGVPTIPPEDCAAIPSQACQPIPPEACALVPPPARPPVLPIQYPGGSDGNVLVVNNSFNPDAVTVTVGQRVNFHNATAIHHTVVSTGCDNPEGATFDCVTFGKSLDASNYGPFAQSILLASRDGYHAGQVYHYKCTVHDGMEGSFTVAAPV